MHTLRNSVLFVCLLLGFIGASLGQGLTGSIAGTVTDSSGATISGATVTVIQQDTNAIHTATTSDVGSYRVPELEWTLVLRQGKWGQFTFRC